MGRYLSGDWEWKFAFGDQHSSFGEVMETICENLSDCWCNRYVGTQGQGEQVELNIEEPKQFLTACKEYLKGFKKKGKKEMEAWCQCRVKFGTEYWDKLMVKKFIKEMDIKNMICGDTFNFYVEY